MYFVFRALKYLRKKIGKTIFMGIIFFVIANFVLAGLLIQQASRIAEENTRLAIGSEINYIQSFDAIVKDLEKGVLDRSVMGKIKSEDILSSADFTINGAPTVSNIKLAVDSEYIDSYQISYEIQVNGDNYTQVQIESGGADNGLYNVKLYENNIPEGFVSGTDKLVAGRMIFEEELENGSQVIMIEERFALQNKLEIGDMLTVTYPEVNGISYKIDHEIVGIYTSSEEASQSIIQSSNVTRFSANQFYAPLYIFNSIGYDKEIINHLVINNNVIRLKDPEDIDVYKQSVGDMINMRYGVLDANDDLYDSLVGPIMIVGLISNIAVIVILITGGLIIGLITALTVNERRSEVGILLAVGERKSKIVMQFVLEVLIIAVITFSLSIISGGFIGKEISESPIASEFIESNEEDVKLNIRGGKGGFSKEKIEVDQPKLKVILSIDIIALLFLIGILLTVISTIIPALYVMRFNPKQILNNKVS